MTSRPVTCCDFCPDGDAWEIIWVCALASKSNVDGYAYFICDTCFDFAVKALRERNNVAQNVAQANGDPRKPQ